MEKSRYYIKETKDRYKFAYTGDLKDALQKARGDLQREKCNPETAYYEWAFKKAQSAILAHNRKMARLEAFIERAEITLEKEESERKE